MYSAAQVTSHLLSVQVHYQLSDVSEDSEILEYDKTVYSILTHGSEREFKKHIHKQTRDKVKNREFTRSLAQE